MASEFLTQRKGRDLAVGHLDRDRVEREGALLVDDPACTARIVQLIPADTRHIAVGGVHSVVQHDGLIGAEVAILGAVGNGIQLGRRSLLWEQVREPLHIFESNEAVAKVAARVKVELAVLAQTSVHLNSQLDLYYHIGNVFKRQFGKISHLVQIYPAIIVSRSFFTSSHSESRIE